jgi:multiple sugar transport system substrate-binding protein
MFRSRFPARRLIALVAGLSVALAACTGAASPSPGPTGTPGTSPADVEPTEAAPAGPVTMLSNQLVPVAEQEAMRNEILAGFDGEVEYVGADPGPYTDRVQAEGTTGSGDVSLIGGLHGDFSAFGDRGYLSDLSDVAADLADLGISQDYLDLGKLGTDEQLYIPWMQATYIMVARNEALDYLPDGADINALTWEQLTEWGAAITDDTGDRKLGFPAGEDGLLHRFFQGHSYPAFTGRVNTAFATSDAVDMWNWLKDTWQYVNPQSTTYGFMQEPLQSGEVWVAWDHVARLIEALKSDASAYTAFPVPAGPEGRAFMPVIAGLAIPTWAPNPDGAKALIRYLLQPDTQATTLRAVSFFPVIAGDLPGDLDPGVQAEQQAVAAQVGASDALPALLPVALGDQGGAYNQVFKDAFAQIIIQNQDPATVLAGLADTLQEVFDVSGAACWSPDPPSDGPCQVGR